LEIQLVDRGKEFRRVDLPPSLKYIRGLAENLRSYHRPLSPLTTSTK
jgi:hypothetical protein